MIVAGLAPIFPTDPTGGEKEKTGFDALDDNQKVAAVDVANSFVGARYKELGIEPVEGAVPPGDLFPPAADVPQLIENGYMDDKGNITPKGDALVAMKNAGLVNEDNTLNEKGFAVITPKEVALRPENLEIFRVREQMQLDDVSAEEKGFYEGYLKPILDSVKNIPSFLGSQARLATSKSPMTPSMRAFGGDFGMTQFGVPLEPEAEATKPQPMPQDIVTAVNAYSGVVKQTAVLTSQASAMGFADPLIKTMIEDDKEQQTALAARRQDTARLVNEIEKVDNAKALEFAYNVSGVVDEYNQAKSQLTPEQIEQADKVGAAGTLAIQLIGGPEALVFKAGAAAGKAAFAPVSRSILHAEKASAAYSAAQKRLYSARNAMAHMASVIETGPQRAAFFERQADKLSSAGNLERSATIRKAAQDIRERVQRATLRSTALADEVSNLEKVVPGLEKAAMSGEYLLKAQNAARQLARVPSEVIGVPLQVAGQTLIGIDRGLKFLSQKVGLGKAYDYINRASTLGFGGGIAAASGLGPMAFVPAAIKGTLAMGPVLNATGKLVRTLGVEGAKVRGSIPYWNRVAQATVNPKTKMLANRMSEIFWGLGKFNQLTRGAIPGAARGAVAGFPVDLGFEYIYSGGNLNWDTIKNAAAESLVIGSSGGAMGAASVSTRDKLIKVHNNDAINFYQNLADPEQRVMFNTLRPEMKRIIGNASAAYPGLNINITKSGGGSYNPNTYTVNINPFSSNPLAPLFSHELNHYIANRTGMEPVIANMLLGDGVQSGGLLRSANGTLDQDFEKWGIEYNRRLKLQHERDVNALIASGEKLTPAQREFKPLNLNQLANEYFVEVNSEEFISMVEEGKLTEVVQRPESVKKMISLAESLIDKSTILRDLHFKIGGMIDTNGRTVMGSGLLADGIKQLPQVRKMYRDMVTDTAGLPAHTRKVSRKEKSGIVIPETGPLDPIYDEMFSTNETDEFGNVLRDENGAAIPLSTEKDFARSQGGLLLIENAMAREQSGQQVDGELKYNPSDDSWIGRFLTDEQVKIIADSGLFNSKQIRNLRMMNDAARDQGGKRFLTVYQAALEKRKGKRAAYKPQQKTMREIVPFGVKITKDGNILVELMSVNQLKANVTEMAAKSQGLKLYNGDPEAIMGDVLEVIRLHGEGKSADEYFKSKPEYSTDWSQRKNFINAVFGAVGRGQADFNPVLNSIKAENGVVKTYRLDRMNKTVDLDGDTVLPYNNNLVRINFLPEGEPIVDANNNIVERGVPGRQEMMPEQPQAATEPFYLKSTQTIQQKVQGKTATLDQIRSILSPQNGIKAEELKWTGVMQEAERLAKENNGKVPKDALLQYLKDDGAVKFEEVTLADAATQKEMRLKRFRESQKIMRDAGLFVDVSSTGEVLLRDTYAGPPNVDPNSLPENLKRQYEIMSDNAADELAAERAEPRFSKYTLPGGENYREVVLTMPQKTTGDPIRSSKQLSDGSFDVIFTDGTEGNYDSLEEARVDGRGTVEIQGVSEYRSSHFPNIPNYVAHMRVNERTLTDGSQGLFVEEFQSDRHQAGRKQGYRGDKVTQKLEDLDIEQLRDILRTADPNGMWSDSERENEGFNPLTKIEALDQIKEFQKDDPSFDVESFLRERSNIDGVADAPFRTTWPIQLFKRALRDAVDGRKDWIGWTTGETQNERFDLSKQVYNIFVPMVNADGSRSVAINAKDGTSFKMMVDSNRIVNGYHSADQFTGKRLDEVVGKDMADKIIALESPANFEGNDLKVGGEGMKGFYDTMLPNEIGKYVKQWGGKVEKVDMTQSVEPDIMSGEEGGTGSIPIWKVDITPKMVESISRSGQVMFMPEVGGEPNNVNAGIKEPIGSLGDLRKNVEIPKAQLPQDVFSVPKYVARENKDADWKVMEGAHRIQRKNFQTPLPNAQVKKTKDFATPKQDIILTASESRQIIISDNASDAAKQQAASKVNAAIDKINKAVMDADSNPEKFVDVRGYAEIMKNAGVTGDILIPPSSLRTMLYKPDDFVALLNGGYHGDKTVAGIRDSAMSGLDAVVEMRELIGNQPPDLITALHHLWGTLSKQLPPLQQEALWMRMIVNKDVMEQIGRSIDGTFNLSPDQWKQIVLKARSSTQGTYGKLGENATSNANSFYLMLSKHNGKWNEVSNVYSTNDAVDMRYRFNTLGHGATGIKNKVQSFIGLTFGIKGNVLDRWRFVDMYLDDVMKITGAKTPMEYFKYEGKSKNVPVDKIGIYKNYGTIENGSPLFSLALYSAMDRVSQRAIDASTSLQEILGNHADPGGLHWLSWNAIKNEAVGHSSLDITKNFIKKYKSGDSFANLTVDNFVDFVNKTEAFVEGTSGAGDEITRLTLKNGVFNYSKK